MLGFKTWKEKYEAAKISVDTMTEQLDSSEREIKKLKNEVKNESDKTKLQLIIDLLNPIKLELAEMKLKFDISEKHIDLLKNELDQTMEIKKDIEEARKYVEEGLLKMSQQKIEITEEASKKESALYEKFYNKMEKSITDTNVLLGSFIEKVLPSFGNKEINIHTKSVSKKED